MNGLPEIGSRFSGDGWAMVYQGGHHNVYCNGFQHVRTSGGKVGIDPPGLVKGITKCDCAKWRE